MAHPTPSFKAALVSTLILLTWITTPLISQTKIKATGTGNTTGHIANLSVTNNGKEPINILPQTVYIPSDGQYQPYVATIPKTTVPPGTTVIPLKGFCADVHTPPVGSGDPLPPLDTWIPVGDPNAPVPDGFVPAVPTKPVSPFDPSDIPAITSSPHYQPVKPNPEANIIITWPGTDKPVGGTINPVADPRTFAPVIVGVLEAIEGAVEVVQGKGIIHTPFSTDMAKERESVIQQTFWIFNASLTGKGYTKENFTQNTYNQFQSTTGKTVASLPPEQKEDVNSGITDFWNAFQATGIAAKVISAESPGVDPKISSVAVQAGTVYYADKAAAEKKDKDKQESTCSCDTMKIHLVLNIENKVGNIISEKEENQIAVFADGKTTVSLPVTVKARQENVEKGKNVELKVTPELICLCSDKDVKCPANTGTLKVTIMHNKEELKKKFNLDAEPYEIKVTVSENCGGDDCKEINCSATTTIIIENETKKQKADREKKEKKAEEKQKKEKEKAEKEKAEKEKKN